MIRPALVAAAALMACSGIAFPLSALPASYGPARPRGATSPPSARQLRKRDARAQAQGVREQIARDGIPLKHMHAHARRRAIAAAAAA